MKQRFLQYGLDSFSDVNILELLLFYTNPRQDVNPVAHALLDRFGSLDAVLEAPAAELEKLPGVKKSAATLLTLVPALSRRYLLAKTPEGAAVDSPAKAGRYFVPWFMYEREEVVFALLLDARKRPLLCQEIGRGTVDAAEISARRLVTLAMERNASGIVLAHNHLSGMALPSAEDESTTARLRNALALVGVTLCDHIIVAGCDYVSMRECGLLR